jgi:3-phosphoshikimate 1-carboxyvinyltransferase
MIPHDVTVPGDKSIAHRLLILGSLAEGRSRLLGVPSSLDVGCTLTCLRSLGAEISSTPEGDTLIEGPAAWRKPSLPLDCGNSGTTARLLAGLLAGLGLEAELRGDRSLSARPMDRVVYPLQAMGARIEYLDSADRLPVRIAPRASGELRSLRYRPRISSAQVRGALLLAGLSSRTDVEILDRGRPRDHTERLLAALGAPVESSETSEGERNRMRAAGWNGHLKSVNATVPGDLSSAAFLIVAALLAGTRLALTGVGLNPTRSGFLRVLEQMGADVRTKVDTLEAGEPVGRIVVEPSDLRPFDFGEEIVPSLLDEIPALVALACRVPGTSVFTGAAELRVKESDRLALLAANLKRLGVRCEEQPDGLHVSGSLDLPHGEIETGGDHRIAMAFGVLSRVHGSRITIDDQACVDVSYPGFWSVLEQMAPGVSGP